MRVESLDGNFAIRQHGVIVARDLDEQLAHQFAASDEMLAVCEKLAEADRMALPDGKMYMEYIDLVAEARDMARVVIAKAKGEQS